MKMAFHILKKDIHHQRFLLPLFVLAVVISAVITYLVPFSYGNGAYAEIASEFSYLIQLVIMVLLIQQVTSSEPLNGTTTFWFTRPVRGIDVLISNLLFVGLFIVVLPALVKSACLFAQHVTAPYLLLALTEDLINHFRIALLFLAYLSITGDAKTCSNLRNGLMGGLIGFGCLSIFSSAFRQPYGHLVDVLPNSVLADSRSILSMLVSIILSSTVLYIIYRRRKFAIACILLVVEIGLSFGITNAAPWSFLTSPAIQLTEEQLERITLSINKTDPPYFRDAKDSDGTILKKVRGYFDVAGLPFTYFAQVSRIESTIDTAGKEIASLEIKPYRCSHRYFHKRALQEVLGPLDLILRNDYTRFANTLSMISEADYLDIKDKMGVYHAETTFDVFRYQTVATLPLYSDDEFTTDRTRMNIETILRKPEGCTVIVREQHINPMFKRDRRPLPGNRYLYILSNRQTGEAYLSEAEDRWYHFNNDPFTLRRRSLQFTSMDKIGSCIDGKWLEQAELIVVEAEWLSEVTQEVEDSVFTVDPPKPVATVPGTSSSDHLSALADISLPDQATRQNALEYILRINAISDTQAFANPSDPQVAMLAKVGKENIDLLLRYPGQHSLYANQAIRLIEGFNPPVPSVTLSDTDAIIEGDIRHYKNHKKIGYWYRPEDRIRFHIPNLQKAKYTLYASYSAPDEHGGKVEIQLNDHSLQETFEGTGSWVTQQEKEIGLFNHQGGALDITMSILEQRGTNSPVMDVYALRLVPIDEYPGPSSIVLSSDDAILEGRLGHNKKWRKIAWWRNPEDQIRFNIPALQQGAYHVSAVYSAPANNGGRIAFQINNLEQQRMFGPTGGGWGTAIEKYVGLYSHQGGEVDITMTMLEQHSENQSVIDLFSILLERVEEKTESLD